MSDEQNDPQEQPEEQSLEIALDQSMRAGVYANWAQVSHTIHEFNIDFVRLDPLVPGQGVVVARIAFSPLFVTQLVDALQRNWEKYAAKAMPKEVHDGPEDHPEDPES